jgi:TRAP-type C4-dicarboxylate transport system substrate-binding protein
MVPPVAPARTQQPPVAAFPVLAAAESADPIRLKIVGGLADVSQYVRHEEPFWRRRIPEATRGRVLAEIAPFDRSGIRGQEMLQLMRLGVVPFGTVLLAVASTEEPELNAADLPAVNPDMAAHRQAVALYRPHLRAVLAERYNIELLAVYTYPAQVVFCRHPFTGLEDLAGRRIRTSSVGQSEMLAALGATPVVTPFAEILGAIRSGVVECAITGTLSGNAIGLHEATSHVHGMAISWGLSFFGANRAAWAALPADIQALLRRELAALEAEIWDAADRETGEGLACNAGLPTCRNGRRGAMTIVPVTPADDARRRRRLVTEAVLPRWVQRCGPDCVVAWNERLAPALGIVAQPE